MKTKEILYLLIIGVFAINCSSDKQFNGNIPSLDVSKEYREKEILLTDIADVTYVHLNSKNADYLYRGGVRYVTENTIVVVDVSSGSILFFSKDGNPKSRFNRYGEGPEEYTETNFFVVYDETSDDVYVNAPGRFTIAGHSVLVYSSTGEYKRKLTLPALPFPLIDFDDRSLLLYDMRNQHKKVMRETDFTSQSIDSSYYRISKTDGTVLEYINFPGNNIDLTNLGDGNNRSMGSYQRIVNGATGIFLCNPETDTVFIYGKDKTLTPVFCKTPLVSNSKNPKVVMTGFLDTGRYQFIQVQTLLTFDKMRNIQRDEYLKDYVYDKQTGEIFRQKMILPDYKGKEFTIEVLCAYFDGKATYIYFNLDLYELKQAYKENRLSGQLKELVATLNENTDNDVIMLVRFI